MTNFKKGDKVLVVSKSFGDKLEQCRYYKELKDGDVKYLYVVNECFNTARSKEDLIVLNSDKKEDCGSLYKKEDLVLYKKESKKDKEIKKLKRIVEGQEEIIIDLKSKVTEHKLGESVEKVNGEYQTDSQEDIVFNGEKYRKVNREAKAGDVVLLNDRGTQFFQENKFYKVFYKYDCVSIRDSQTNTTGELYSLGRNKDNVDVYEKVKAEPTFKVGDKVIPVSKWGDKKRLQESVALNQAKLDGQEYLYVNNIKVDGTIVCNDEKVDFMDGDFFIKEDLVHYEENSDSDSDSDSYSYLYLKYLDKINDLEEENKKLKEEIEELKLDNGKLLKKLEMKQKEIVNVNINQSTTDNYNHMRKSIIEGAKSFIENNKVGYSNFYHVEDKENGGSPWNCLAEFYVNHKEKTVEVVMRGINSGREYAREIAKCKDSDVFNIHIGKAIALGRALGLDTYEFENVVQPTIAVGQTTEILYSYTNTPTGEICDVVSINKDGKPVYADGEYASHYKITDDTKALY